MSRMRLGPPTLAGLDHVCRNLRERDRRELAMLAWKDDAGWRAQRLFDVWGRCWRAHIVSVATPSRPGSWPTEPVAILMLQWNAPTSVTAALLATERWGEIVVPLARHCLREIKPAAIAAGILRVECRTWEGHASARRFLGFFGAKVETRLPGYGRLGETFLQYAWTRPDVAAADADREDEHVQGRKAEGLRVLASAYHH